MGKTLIARLLFDFLRLSGRQAVGYDLNPHEPMLAAHYPNLVWPVDIASGAKWRCSTGTSVIDLSHGMFEQVLDTIRIPRLSTLVRGVIDKPGFSFGAYMKTRAGGPTEVLGSEASSRSFASSNAADYRPANPAASSRFNA